MTTRSLFGLAAGFFAPVCGASLAIATTAVAAIGPLPFVSPAFSDNMVLQRGKPNTFWGWTRPNEEVRVTIGERTARGVADVTGRWQVRLEPPAAGVDCTVQIDGPEQVTLKNVLVGDVWLCGGQSNMQFALAAANDGAREVAAADAPQIRLFKVTTRTAYSPVETMKGRWKVCSPQSVIEDGGFSAVAYFFARRVQTETGIPIGLVEACLGGTPAETWMSPAAVAATKQFDLPLAEIERLRQAGAPEYGNYISHWYDAYDIGLRGRTWADPELDSRNWKNVQVPGGFAEFGLADSPAVCWFRREVVLPDPLPAGGATIRLGVVEKMDTTYVNGQWVGASSWVENPRVYPVPATLLKPGANLITIRVLKVKSQLGFLSQPEDLALVLADGTRVPLAGEWKAEVSVDARPPHPLPLGYENYPIMPTVLYQGMIHPLAPLAITGALWYQGEANASRAYQYRTLLPAMIGDWRRTFAQGDFPFLVVGLPAFQSRKAAPGTDDWAELREAQALTARSVPNCGLAVMIDTGEADNIHPKEKKAVGERLALLALAGTYGKAVVAHGPAFRSMSRLGPALRIEFDHAEGGLEVRGEKLEEFSIAGSDRQWRWAEARIEGDRVIVSSPDVPEPVAVRYAWQANPRATLFNGAGLPATPFRSDDWPGVTEGHSPW